MIDNKTIDISPNTIEYIYAFETFYHNNVHIKGLHMTEFRIVDVVAWHRHLTLLQGTDIVT